ncbi:MAG TPA: kynureninase [Pyrinomonadaceae bacterium]
MQPTKFEASGAFAAEMDTRDPLRKFRQRFHLPRQPGGADVLYFAGNSLGLQPKTARARIEQELKDWETLGVEGHFHAQNPWLPYHELLTEQMAKIVGAKAIETVVMNSLTVNLHLMMVSFYRPTPERNKIVIEAGAFPSDQYAVQSQIKFHQNRSEPPVVAGGLTQSVLNSDKTEDLSVQSRNLNSSESFINAQPPATTGGSDLQGDWLIKLAPRAGETCLRTEDIEKTIVENGDSIALVLLGGVNYYTGQAYDMKRITEIGHRIGAVVGFDLAHAAGNIELHLHDWNVDFAAWCSYKYLNAGPGAIAGCFVHERHAARFDLPRFAGWWGHDKETRFLMQSDFQPIKGAEGWQLSNPPIFQLAALKASLDVFEEAGMRALTEKSRKLTGYLEFLLGEIKDERISVITPANPESRGCQLSIRVRDADKNLFRAITAKGVVADWREPDVIRVAPVPLYNTFTDVYKFAETLKICLA